MSSSPPYLFICQNATYETYSPAHSFFNKKILILSSTIYCYKSIVRSLFPFLLYLGKTCRPAFFNPLGFYKNKKEQNKFAPFLLSHMIPALF